jgi:site-specific DNA-methyltransferase (adenine-specific)
MSGNALFYGDNLDILRRYIRDESVDLVYLDPPFNSNATYNVLFADKSGTQSEAQIKAFEDTWQWDRAAAGAYQETVESGGDVSRAMQAFRTVLGTNDMLAYLSMMAPRLVELRRVLKATGSIYLHCDPTASHYLKVLMDAVFGPRCFKNEIVWKRTTTHSDSRTWSRVADVLLFFSRGEEFTWNIPRERHSETYIRSKYRHDDGDGRKYQLHDMTSPNPRPNMMYEWKGFSHPLKGWRFSRETMAALDRVGKIWYPLRPDGSLDTSRRPRIKRYLDEQPGVVMGTIWSDISPINSQAQERLGYPTQKPEALLERIVAASSNEGDLVLDPFCGCGTTIAAAQKLERRWIGIDITHLAIGLIKHRLRDSFGKVEYDVIGEPTTVSAARQLATEDPFQFQYWALGLVGARKSEQKRGADQGIDGRLYFHDNPREGAKQIILSVKSGERIGVRDVRDLRGVIEREKAQIGVLIALHQPTHPMRREAASAGFYESPWGKHPSLQILTIEELLDGKGIDAPTGRANVTFKQAPRYRRPVVEQQGLPLAADAEEDYRGSE